MLDYGPNFYARTRFIGSEWPPTRLGWLNGFKNPATVELLALLFHGSCLSKDGQQLRQDSAPELRHCAENQSSGKMVL